MYVSSTAADLETCDSRVCQCRLSACAHANRSSSRAHVSTNRQVACESEGTHGILAVHDDDKVTDLGADLQTEAGAAGRDARRRGPAAIRETCDHDAGAGTTGPDEALLCDSREH